MAIAVVIPARFGERSCGEPRPASHVYARRRLMAMLMMFTIVLVLLASAGHVVANRGGAPASASTIRPATPAASTAAPATVYIVQAGDTLWSIGQRFHGRAALADYVDALVAANGGTRLQVAQAVTLP